MAVSLVKSDEPAKSEKAPETPSSPKRGLLGSELLRGVRVCLEVRLGDAPMTVEEMMALKPGSVVPLETALADHVELHLNGTLIGRGEIVAVGDKFGVRIVEIAAS